MPNLITSNQSYSVVMKLCEIIIEDGGFNYDQSDEILITPNSGAIARPYFTPSGSLYKIEILNKGEGFKEYPSISINTKTGFNASLTPRLCAETINTPVPGKIINVVDCVGK